MAKGQIPGQLNKTEIRTVRKGSAPNGCAGVWNDDGIECPAAECFLPDLIKFIRQEQNARHGFELMILPLDICLIEFGYRDIHIWTGLLDKGSPLIKEIQIHVQGMRIGTCHVSRRIVRHIVVSAVVR